MEDQTPDPLSPADLADCEAQLPEWDSLAVRDYWEAVIEAELGAPLSPGSSMNHPRPVRYRRSTGDTVLRLVTSAEAAPTDSALPWDEAA